MQSTRGKSISLIGAMDNRVGLVHYMIFEGSNNRFKEFMEGLIAKLANKSAMIILDNLPIHKSQRVIELAKGTRCTIMNTPPYSCSLNAIEWLWHVVKWRSWLLQ